MLIILSGIILAFSVLFVVSLFKLQRLSELLLAFALVAFANIVLVMQIANLLHHLNEISVVLIIQVMVLLFCVGIWLWRRRPPLFQLLNVHWDIKSFLRDAKNWPLTLLLISLIAALAIDLVLIYIVPPNNNDALAIHLSRVLKWNQFGSFFPWETPYFWQVTFPVNAQLAFYWTMLFTRSDSFVAYIPCLAGLATAVLVYLLSIELGFHPRLAVFAAAIWLSFPVVQLHLTSVRHDLLSTWLFVSCIYFFHRWGKNRNLVYMGLSALSLGLVVGTNFSIAAYLPGLVIFLVIWVFFQRLSIKQILGWGASVALAFTLFSSPIYVSNLIHFRSPMGPDVGKMTSAAMMDEVGLGEYIGINITRWSYQMVDFSSLPDQIKGYGLRGKAKLADLLSSWLKVDFEGDRATMNAHEFSWRQYYQLQEDEAWYGLIGMALIFPTSLIAFVRGIKRKETLLLAPFIFLVTAMVTCTLIRPGWTPYDGRYFMPLAALSAYLLPTWLVGRRSSVLIQSILSVVAITGVVLVLLSNPAKPIFGETTVWRMNRIDKLTLQSRMSREMLYLVEKAIPQEAVVGLAAVDMDIQEYGIYGEHFSRKIYEVFPPERIGDADWLRARGIEYLLIVATPTYPAEIPEGYTYVDSAREWLIVAYQH